MEFLADIISIVGLSGFVTLVAGAGLGVYLAAVHSFVPVRRVRRSVITDVVVGLSFFIPLALMRVLFGQPTLGPAAWIAFTLLWFTFSITADLTNYAVCRWRQSLLKAREK
jgi:hypothetical protein